MFLKRWKECLVDDSSLKFDVSSYVDNLIEEMDEKERALLVQSKLAFDAAIDDSVDAERDARAINGFIVTDTENTETRFDVIAIHQTTSFYQTSNYETEG